MSGRALACSRGRGVLGVLAASVPFEHWVGFGTHRSGTGSRSVPCVAGRGIDPGVLQDLASQATSLSQESGEVAGEWRGPCFWACLTGCTPEGVPVPGMQGWRWSGLHLGRDWCSRQGWQRYSTEVQQLTRTRADLCGRGRTVTLHRWTRVDVLPPDGMQEVRSSNLLSSTLFSCMCSAKK
jgi:hypothetical protein